MEQPQTDTPWMRPVHIMATTNLYYALTACTLTINGILDMRYRRICSFPVLLTMICGIFLSGRPWLCIVGILILLGVNDERISCEWIGAGDIDAMFLVASALGLGTLSCLMDASLIALLWGWICHEKTIPFVFFIWLSFLTACAKMFLF